MTGPRHSANASGIGRGGTGTLKVDDKDYPVPFPFTAKFHKLTVKLGPEDLTPEEQEMIYGTYRAKQ